MTKEVELFSGETYELYCDQGFLAIRKNDTIIFISREPSSFIIRGVGIPYDKKAFRKFKK